MTTVRTIDLRVARICFRGARPWFRDHGISWADFVVNGVDAEVLIATGDGIVEPVVKAAREREGAVHG
uniref:hypothetical protein n=1 Tax=Paenirhodobacter enshiensis TaxID=1105367 RepID=UPI0035B3155B